MKYKYLVSLNRTPNKPHFRRPIVDVLIFGQKGSVPTIALLDSGADYCLFNIEFAKQIGLDETAFRACMTDERYTSVIEQSNSDARTLGITGTPAFFVIGPDNIVSKIGGAQPYEVFEKIFESQLKK